MSLSSEHMMKLMAYADGELEGAERTEAEMLLASNVDAVTFIEQIAGLGEFVELGHDDRVGKTIKAFDVADAVMAAVNQDAAETRQAKTEKSNVASFAAAREKKRSGLKMGVGIAAALALAASVFVFVQHRNEETPMAIAPTPAAQPAASGAPGTGVAIESAGKSVRVF
jgi:anti-sigma factor RsiW